MKEIFVFLFVVMICAFCNAREIKFKFSDMEGKAIDNVTINVTTSTLKGQWEELRGIDLSTRTIKADSGIIFPIDEKAYTLTFHFKKEGFFLEKWDFPIYSTNKHSNIEKEIIFAPQIKNKDICVKKIVLTYHIENDKKNIIPFCGIVNKNKSNTTPKRTGASICLDVSRDINGEVINTPISKFNTTRFCPKSIIVKLDNANTNDGFLCIKDTAIKKMITAPQSGYSSILEVNPRKPELFFYCQIDGYFGKGIIHRLNQRKDNQWEMTIIFIINTKKGNNSLQSDFDYENQN